MENLRIECAMRALHLYIYTSILKCSKMSKSVHAYTYVSFIPSSLVPTWLDTSFYACTDRFSLFVSPCGLCFCCVRLSSLSLPLGRLGLLFSFICLMPLLTRQKHDTGTIRIVRLFLSLLFWTGFAGNVSSCSKRWKRLKRRGIAMDTLLTKATKSL